ncbi:MAG: restriction endonuclease [Candidatus Parabeggiatoa sp. nov. 1]|nr:MAG: restriction endonuclease [Gammaproteobacteria bacterium]
MKIVETYSHLNGLEFLLVHKKGLWEEIQNVINEIDGETCKTKVSKEKRMKGRLLYSPIDLNKAFKEQLETKKWTESRSRVRDFLKDRVAIEVQFGKYSFVAYDLFAKHLAFYVSDQIDVGIEILPMKSLQGQMSSGVAYYEGELYNVIRQGRGVPAVPLVIIGIEP